MCGLARSSPKHTGDQAFRASLSLLNLNAPALLLGLSVRQTSHPVYLHVARGLRDFTVLGPVPTPRIPLSLVHTPVRSISGFQPPLTWSVSHSRLQVLWASTQRLGFMSLGQMPAWE